MLREVSTTGWLAGGGLNVYGGGGDGDLMWRVHILSVPVTLINKSGFKSVILA